MELWSKQQYLQSLLNEREVRIDDRYLDMGEYADKVLYFGGNSALCGNFPFPFTKFSEYDYIGAPWGLLEEEDERGNII